MFDFFVAAMTRESQGQRVTGQMTHLEIEQDGSASQAPVFMSGMSGLTIDPYTDVGSTSKCHRQEIIELLSMLSVSVSILAMTISMNNKCIL